RGLEVYAWEGYDSGGGVILSRERRKWTRELVGTVRLSQFADAEELIDELACLLFLAVVGTSRLPLHSVEAPLPDFSNGRLFYCYRPPEDELPTGPASGRTRVGAGSPDPAPGPDRRSPGLPGDLRSGGVAGSGDP